MKGTDRNINKRPTGLNSHLSDLGDLKTSRLIVFEQSIRGLFTNYILCLKSFVSIEVMKSFHSVTSSSQIQSKDSGKKMTLTFDLYVILIDQCHRFIFKWYDVYTMYGTKVAYKCFNKT